MPPIHAAGSTVGCDYSGTVVQAGPNVKQTWQPGDRIAGVTHGCNKCDLAEGAFAEYALVREGVQMKVPAALSSAEAATVGVGVLTTGHCLYQELSLPWPGSVPANCWVLIYGGSTSTGSIAIQFAALSGARVVTTASAKNADFVKSLGAEEAFDYRDPECARKIREFTDDGLHFVVDCYGGDPATAICAESVSSRGGQIVSIIAGEEYPRQEDVRRTLVLAYKAMGREWDLFGRYLATHEDYEFASMVWRLAGKLFAEGKIKVHPPRVGEGFEGVIEGLDEMRKGLVSATKLVYKI